MRRADVAGAIADFDASDAESQQETATFCYWLLTADDLKRRGLLGGGPEIDREAMTALLQHAKSRGVAPDQSEGAMRQVLDAVAASSDAE